MTYKELKQGNTIWVFDQTNLSVQEGKVMSVSTPRFENKIGMPSNMVVDVTIETDGNSMTYVFLSDGSKAWSNNLCFYICKSDILIDIRSIKAANEAEVAKVDKRHSDISKCEKLLAELDTEEKKRMEMENRIASMESRFDKFEGLLEKIANKTI